MLGSQVFETMRQSDPGGYVSCQLGHRYNKHTRSTLRTEMDRCKLRDRGKAGQSEVVRLGGVWEVEELE